MYGTTLNESVVLHHQRSHSGFFTPHPLTSPFIRFASMGFVDPVTAVAVLTGAHNIGKVHATVASSCCKGLSSMTNHANSFDGHYYTEVVQQTGKGG